MVNRSATVMKGVAQAVAAAADCESAQLAGLDPRQRGLLIESACEAAAILSRSRLAAGLGPVEPAPWPPSTWAFLRKHASRVRNEQQDGNGRLAAGVG
jgi:hypothetical protein